MVIFSGRRKPASQPLPALCAAAHDRRRRVVVGHHHHAFIASLTIVCSSTRVRTYVYVRTWRTFSRSSTFSALQTSFPFLVLLPNTVACSVCELLPTCLLVPQLAPYSKTTYPRACCPQLLELLDSDYNMVATCQLVQIYYEGRE